MYIDFTEYSAVYNDLTAQEFDIYGYKASIELDKQTTGIDGFKKLKEAFPDDPDDVIAVKTCAIDLVHTLKKITDAENASNVNGAGGQIASISSGSESISYKTGTNIYELSASDPLAKRKLINSVVIQYLSGVTDKNGINLLYMGVYPIVL